MRWFVLWHSYLPLQANSSKVCRYLCLFSREIYLWENNALHPIYFWSNIIPYFFRYSRQKHHKASLTLINCFEWVSDCCLAPTQSFSAISWREQINFQWNDDEVRFVLDQHAQWIDMSPHSDTLSLFRVNQSLLVCLNVACLAEKQQIPILMSMVLPDRGLNPHTIYNTGGEHANHYITDTVKSQIEPWGTGTCTMYYKTD